MVGYMGTSLFINRIFAGYHILWASQVALVVKNPSANVGDTRDASSIPRSGRSLGRGLGNPLQYSCLKNPIDRGAWRAIVYGVAKSWTQPRD